MYVEIRSHFWAETCLGQSQYPLFPSLFRGTSNTAHGEGPMSPVPGMVMTQGRARWCSGMDIKCGVRSKRHTLSY